jgi:phage major head subunit gpT-like protein
MPIVRSDIPQLLLPGLKSTFFHAYDNVPDITWPQIATEVPSSLDTERYAWLGSVPKMREFKDERVPAGLLEHDYSIRNRTWEASISVDRTALEDDQYGQIKLRVQNLAEETRRHQQELVIGQLMGGFTQACYDGQTFFSADHQEGDSPVQSNLGSDDLSVGSLQAAITMMMKFKDDKGKPMGIIPDTLVVPPDLKWLAMEILHSHGRPDTANRADNVLHNALELIVDPYLTDTNDWYVFCTKRFVKPIIFQNRVPVEFASLEGYTDTGFMRDQFIYGVRARYNVGYGIWQLAYGSQVS